ncbi:MAG: hypothetical protein NTZ04_05145 [Chloroflexi bacterium]|nr:hypothetical protein [Chloroflexota bacterium]
MIGSMKTERTWVYEHKVDYVRRLWEASQNSARDRARESGEEEKQLLVLGLKALWRISQTKGHDEYVAWGEIVREEPSVRTSPTGGLWAWLDDHGGKLGAGIVERKPLSVTRQYKIRKEFRKAVDEVVGGAA